MQQSEHSSILRPAMAALTATAVLAALFWFGWTLLLWFRWHPHLPWRDLFVVLGDLQPLLEGQGAWRDWLVLFEPHYAAHRIALPRVLVALDVKFFHGQGHLLYAAGWLGLAVLVALYAGWSRNFFREQQVMWWFSTAVLGVLVFAPAHLWNLVNAINVSWHLSFALAALSLAVLLRSAVPPGPTQWFVAYALATLCAFTTFAGVVLWLLLPVLALGGRPLTLVATLVISGVFTWLYLDGISSDAAIAMAWQGDNQLVVEQIQQAGQQAVDRNNLTRIVQRTAELLCWPMSEGRAGLSLLVFFLSLPVLTLAGYRFVRAAFLPDEPMPRWLKLCLLLSTLSLGIALAIQFGRVIEQPNHIHGPSYERYNTIVAVYWAGVFGLLLGAARLRSPAVVLAVMLLTLSSVYLLLKPGGHYLRQEIENLEIAASLYAAGETRGLRGKVDTKLLRFKPEFVYSFESLFKEKKLAYMHPEVIPFTPVALPDCEPGRLVRDTDMPELPGFLPATSTAVDVSSLLSRRLLVADQGRLLGRLSPRHEGDFSPLALILPRLNGWAGYVTIGSPGAASAQLSAIRPGRTAAQCVVSVPAMAASREVPADDGRSESDV